MDCSSDGCLSGSIVSDQTNGCFVCETCGKVEGREIYFSEDQGSVGSNYPSPNERKILEEINDILDRAHISVTFSRHILNYYLAKYRRYSLKGIVFSIYKILNDKFNFNLSLQALLNITGLNRQPIFSVIKPDENVLLDVSEMIERYCSHLSSLTFKDITLIKDQIKNQPLTGHTPLTIIASNIYLYCKVNKKKVSVRKISDLTSVSPISIQRYIKKQRCSFTQEIDTKQVVD